MKRLVLVFIVMVMPSVLLAQTSDQPPVTQTGLTVSPAIFELVVEPGEIKQQTFFISNPIDEPVPVVANVKRLTPIEEVIDPTQSFNFDASTWITISENYHILGGKEQRALTATVTVPETAEPGGHYATIVLEPVVPVMGTGSNTAKVGAQVGIIVFITVKGDVVTDISLQNPQVGWLQPSRDVPIEARFVNTGTIHVLPTSKVIVKNIFGSIKAELPLKPRIVLPNTIKEFATTWQEPFLFGIYSAQIEGTYGPDQTPIASNKQYFAVVRWLPLLLVVLLGGGFVLFTFKTYRRWPRAYRAFTSKHHLPQSPKTTKPKTKRVIQKIVPKKNKPKPVKKATKSKNT